MKDIIKKIQYFYDKFPKIIDKIWNIELINFPNENFSKGEIKNHELSNRIIFTFHSSDIKLYKDFLDKFLLLGSNNDYEYRNKQRIKVKTNDRNHNDIHMYYETMFVDGILIILKLGDNLQSSNFNVEISYKYLDDMIHSIDIDSIEYDIEGVIVDYIKNNKSRY